MNAITSPNFPKIYFNNVYCIWNIRAPLGFLAEVKIESFDTQRDSDYLYIGHGVDKFNGEFGEWVRLSGSLRDIWSNTHYIGAYISMIFTSDGQTVDKGFEIALSFSIKKITELPTQSTVQSSVISSLATAANETSSGELSSFWRM